MNRQFSSPVLALVVASSLTAVIAGLSAGAGAQVLDKLPGTPQPSPPSVDASTPEEYLTRAYGVTVAEAKERLARQFSAQGLSDQLTTRFPEEFGGIWIDNSGEGRVKVALTAGNPEAVAFVRGSPIAPWIDIVVVPASLTDLSAIADRLLAERNSLEDLGLPEGFAFGVDPRAQRVFIYQPGLTDRQKAEIARRFGPLVEVVEEELSVMGEDTCSSLDTCGPPLRGSVRARNATTGGTSSYCCNTRSTANQAWYGLVAGHAVNADRSDRIEHNTRFVGNVTGSLDSGRHDSARILIDGNQRTYWDDIYGNPSRWFFGASGSSQQFRFVNRNPDGVVIGATICRSGVTTGHRCGEILQANANPWGTNNDHLLMTTACADPGDSGGPYYTNTDNGGYRAGTISGMHHTSEDPGCTATERTFAVHILHQETFHSVQVVVS